MSEPGVATAAVQLPESLEARLTRQFYEWETRGRGWQVWDGPVELEPPFRPFLGHYASPPRGGIADDGRKATFFSSIADGLRSIISGKSHPSGDAASQEDDVEEPDARRFKQTAPLVEIQVALPPETKITKDAAEQFLLSLGQCSRPASFELVGTPDSIVVQIACGQPDRFQVHAQLLAYFPDGLFTEQTGYLSDRWDESGVKSTAVVEFGLSHEFMRPLRCYERFDPDPLAGAIGAMTGLTASDVAVLQVLFVPTTHPWPESIMRAVTDGEGGDFFVDDDAIVRLAGQKIASPLFAAVIRVGAQSSNSSRALRIARGVGKSLRQLGSPRGNELIPLTNDGYNETQHASDLVYRRSCRSGMLLNSDELVSLVHLPSASVRAEKLKREERKTKAAPALAVGHKLVLGENDTGNKTVQVAQSPDQRVRHTYLIGASGTGKSTLLLRMIVQDIQNGEGLAVLDPHGDLIDHILPHIPKERIGDVILVDPSDEEYPVGFNILSAHSELERNLLASDLVAVFRRLSTSWGDQMTSVLGNAILAFLESSTSGTLADLRKFLVEAEFRQRFLETVRDPETVYYWRREFPLLRGKPQASILTRLDTFLRPKIIRHMVSQKENHLDFGGIMNGRKILLAKLSQGLIGEENSYLLGTLLVSKLNQTAMSRQEMQAVERKHFYLYIDEFHNFVTPSMAAILSGARKYHLGLILAHQELHQLWNRDSDVASAVISNPYTRVCFRLGDFDAKKLEDGFSYFNAKDLQNLGVGEAICRIERAEYDFNLKTTPLPAIDQALAADRRERIIASSRERHAMRRVDVAELLAHDRPPTPPLESVQAKKLVPKATAPVPPPPAPPPPEPFTPPVPHEIPKPTQPPPLGRGGQQHKYLQQLIKRWAEDRGYRTTIEKPILDGLGSVDVALEKGERSIACEISVSTTAEHELGNVQKCLAAGFQFVVVLATERKVLSRITAAASGLDAADIDRVRFFLPEELFSFLERKDAEAESKEQAVRGYKVRVKLNPVTAAEQQVKKQVIAQTILHSLRRLKDKGDS